VRRQESADLLQGAGAQLGLASRLPVLPGPAVEQAQPPEPTHMGQRVILGQEVAARPDLANGLDREMSAGLAQI
jgi:hypothetical protein